MTYLTVFNGSDAPVVVSDDGRTIGGGDWGTGLSTDDAVKQALDADRLVKVTPPEGDAAEVNPAAQAAFDRTALFTARAEAVTSWDKATLEGFAASAGLVGDGDQERGVVELRRLITESTVELPSKSTAKKAAQAREESSN